MNTFGPLISKFDFKEIWPSAHKQTFYSQYFDISPAKENKISDIESDVLSLMDSPQTLELLTITILTQKFSVEKHNESLILNGLTFQFTRQKTPPYLCVTDFVNTHDEIVLFVATTNRELLKFTESLKKEGKYSQSYLLSALSLFLVDQSLSLLPFAGKRFSFGH